MARPSIYTEELAKEICTRIANGESVRSIARDNEMPNASTIHAWVLDNMEFSKQYETACNIRAENMFEELEEIADLPDDKESPMRSRLRVDTRKWYLSKIMPKKFGDKIDMTSNGKPLPTPLLYNVPTDNSTKENTEAHQED